MLRLAKCSNLAAVTLKSIRCQSNTSFASHKYSSTVFLPETKFPSRSDQGLIERELKPQTTTQLYKWNCQKVLKNDDIKELFILHDGPPYANGDLHVGHALNKVLKDIINRFELMQGKKVNYIPGWDCHGLPIELKTLEKLGKERKDKEKTLRKQIKKLDKTSKEYVNLEKELKSLKNSKLSPMEIIKLSGEHALNAKENQSKGFQDLAIMGDFEHPYLTLHKSFVVDQLKVFKRFFDNGLVHRQNKPVYWGCENASALAEGELEYNPNHVSKTAYVKFPLCSLPAELTAKLKNIDVNKLYALIWTSTPWTLASNLAISINKDFEYTILTHSKSGYLIVAEELADTVKSLDPEHYSSTHIKFSGSLLLKATYLSPILNNSKEYPFLHGTHVTSTAGTGLVHTAPGHGQDDYLVGLKNCIAPYSPVDQYGKYTNELEPALNDFVGLKVLSEGNDKMLERIEELGVLVHRNDDYVHSYPYDWRSKKPIVIRATPQWFIDVSKIKERTVDALLENVDFYPNRGSKRLISFIKTRNEWCISRQRSWGVPIPVLYNKETGEELLDDEVIEKITSVIEKEDISSWVDPDSDMKKWLPEKYHKEVDQYVRGTDTMDVWFDSGSSWNVIERYLENENLLEQAKNRGYLADVYLEGSDQHRGWFQSSVLTKLGAAENGKGVLPYKKIITHGFTLDEKGDKMSKSLGNTFAPVDILNGNKSLNIPKLGIDGLRLWVAQSDYSNDISIGPTILKHVGDNLKKIRFTFRFLLGNLSETEAKVPYEKLSGLDRYVLRKLSVLEAEAKEGFETYSFSKVVKSVNQFINVTLSSIYFDVRKDCLYTEALHSSKRLATLTVFNELLKSLVTILGPILPILTQEVWNNSPNYITQGLSSNFQLGWYKTKSETDISIETEFTELLKFRDQIKSLMDNATREDKNVKNSLETGVTIITNSAESKWCSLLLKHKEDIADLLVVSDFEVVSALTDDFKYQYMITLEDGVDAVLRPAKGEKCPRCWKFTKEKKHDLCERCKHVISV